MTTSARNDIDILVVDDQPIVRQLIRDLLRRLGFIRVDEAADGQEALVKIRAKKYALVFSDWSMEPINGIILTKMLRASGNMVPIIMITSNHTPAHKEEAKKAGVNNLIGKDIDLTDLKIMINKILGE